MKVRLYQCVTACNFMCCYTRQFHLQFVPKSWERTVCDTTSLPCIWFSNETGFAALGLD